MYDSAHRSPVSPPEFAKSHDFFIGIDSDGCAFDTMEVKHKECFIPNIIKYLPAGGDLQVCARGGRVRQSLFDQSAGINRFPGLVLTMDLLPSVPRSCGGVRGSRRWRACATGSSGRRGSRTRPWRRRSRRPATPTWRLALRMERGGQPIDQRNREATSRRSRWFASRSRACRARPT